MKKIILLILIVGIMGCGESEAEKAERRAKQRQEKLAQIKSDEQYLPTKYFEVISTKQEMNFWGTKSEFEIIIKNNAEYTTYKNIQFTIEWLSNQDKVLTTWEHNTGIRIEPTETKKVKFEKGTPPEHTKKYLIHVTNAEYVGTRN